MIQQLAPELGSEEASEAGRRAQLWLSQHPKARR
jgi:hypothetical protein